MNDQMVFISVATATRRASHINVGMIERVTSSGPDSCVIHMLSGASVESTDPVTRVFDRMTEALTEP